MRVKNKMTDGLDLFMQRGERLPNGIGHALHGKIPLQVVKEVIVLINKIIRFWRRPGRTLNPNLHPALEALLSGAPKYANEFQ